MANGFLDLKAEFSNFDTAEFAILAVPYEGTATFLKGTAAAPQAIIKASCEVELFDDQLLAEFHQCGIYTAKPTDCRGSCELVQQKIYTAASALLAAGKTVIGLGGEHSITPALVKAASERYPKLSVLQFDAHADLRDEYLNSKFNHACVMRRIWDMQIPAVAVGVRSFSKEEYEFILEKSLSIFSPRHIASNPDWITEVISALRDDVYITVDIDALDPAYVPGTGTPEPAGLCYQQVVDLIVAAGRSRRVVGADIVEVIPATAGVASEFTAARLAYKIIAAAQLKEAN